MNCGAGPGQNVGGLRRSLTHGLDCEERADCTVEGSGPATKAGRLGIMPH